MYRLNQQRYLDWCLVYIPVQAISTEIFGLVFGIYTCTGYINRDIWTGVWNIYMYRLYQQRYLDWCLEYIHVQAISTEIFGLVFGIYTCTG